MQYVVKWWTAPGYEPRVSNLIRRPYPDDFRCDQVFMLSGDWEQTHVLQWLKTGRLDDTFDEITEAKAREILAQLAPSADIDRALAIEPLPRPAEPLVDSRAGYASGLTGTAHVFPVSHDGRLSCYVWYSEDDTSAGVQQIVVGGADVSISVAWLRALQDAEAAGLRPSEAWARLSVSARAEGRGDVHFDDVFTVGSRAELTALMTDPGPN